MATITKILVGLDVVNHGESLTPGSRTVLSQALRLAKKTGASVDGLHSIFDDAEQRGSFEFGEVYGGREEAEKLYSESGVSGTPWKVAHSRPFEALTGEVVQGGYDLLMVAKRAHLTRSQRRLGTVSKKVLHNCPGRVWVVHPEHGNDPASVLAATDLSKVGDQAVDEAADIAGLFDSKLAVAHAWQLPMELQLGAGRMPGEEIQRRRDEIAAAAHQHITALASIAALPKAPEMYLSCDAPAHYLQRVAEETKPDLVALGTVSRGGLPGILVGNTAEKLLDRLDASLLTVKPADFVCPLSFD